MIRLRGLTMTPDTNPPCLCLRHRVRAGCCSTSTTVVQHLYLLCGIIALCIVYALSSMHLSQNISTAWTSTFPGHRLAVVVPINAGDIHHALNAIREWPSTCYHDSRRYTADLILFYADGEDNRIPTSLSNNVATLNSPCFATTTFLHGDLGKEEHVYPKNLPVQLYKMLQDLEAMQQLSPYHALALLQWEANVGHDSIESLYRNAFENQEAFGLKDRTTPSVGLHPTPDMPESWYVPGHFNDIYSNIDRAYIDFLARMEYSRNQQGYLRASTLSIPVTTLAVSPYRWFLWQQISNENIGSTLIDSTDSLNDKDKRVQDGADIEMLFVHNSGNGQENKNSGGRTSLLHSGEENNISINGEQCTSLCGSRQQSLPPGASTVCDSSCFPSGGEVPRFGGYLCGAGDAPKYGQGCRLCYTDLEEAQTADEALREKRARDMKGRVEKDCEEGHHVIMCDTLAPPPARGCHTDCVTERKAVCDMRCKDEPSEGMNCNWRDHGVLCRPCFINVELARAVNIFGHRRDHDSVIMCDTHEPPLPKTCMLGKDPEGVVMRK